MAIKEILFFLPTYPDAPSGQTIESTFVLAKMLGAKVTALVPQLNHDGATWPPVVGAFFLDIPGLRDEAVHGSERNAERLAAELTTIAAEHGIPLDIRRSLTTLYGSAQPLVDQARLHDLTVLPVPETDSFNRICIEPVIFDSGRPTLLLPSGKERKPLQALGSVVLAWDFSREATRALSDALPVLLKAKQVNVVTVRGEKHLQTTCGASDLNKYLDSHGIRYTLKDAVLKDDSIGECLTAYAVETHADMLVMGAYGHARLREFFLGGATRSMLAGPPLPLFLSH